MSSFSKKVGRDARRRLRSQKEEGRRTVWLGLGTFGLVGWSVVVPTLAGIGLGVWLDKRSPQAFSWTLTLMSAGILLGCCNAWYWITKEQSVLFEHLEEQRCSDSSPE